MESCQKRGQAHGEVKVVQSHAGGVDWDQVEANRRAATLQRNWESRAMMQVDQEGPMGS